MERRLNGKGRGGAGQDEISRGGTKQEGTGLGGKDGAGRDGLGKESMERDGKGHGRDGTESDVTGWVRMRRTGQDRTG